MQIKLLKDIVSEVAGESAVKIVDLLYEKKNVNEFLIAKKLSLTINQTRNILYKLLDVGLVSFVRKKDGKKGGWYTYFWTMDVGRALELLRDRINKKIEGIERELHRRKSERFYYSPEANIEYTEVEALENNFICPETGGILELRDNSAIIKSLENEISRIRNELDKANAELSLVEGKERQARIRAVKLEERKKAKEREKKRRKARADKKREERKKARERKSRKRNKRRKSRGGKRARKKIRKSSRKRQ